MKGSLLSGKGECNVGGSVTRFFQGEQIRSRDFFFSGQCHIWIWCLELWWPSYYSKGISLRTSLKQEGWQNRYWKNAILKGVVDSKQTNSGAVFLVFLISEINRVLTFKIWVYFCSTCHQRQTNWYSSFRMAMLFCFFLFICAYRLVS